MLVSLIVYTSTPLNCFNYKFPKSLEYSGLFYTIVPARGYR